jgi:hypothetical protein
MSLTDEIDDEWPEDEGGCELFGWSLEADGANSLRLGLRYASRVAPAGADYLRLVVPAEAARYLVDELTRQVLALNSRSN